MKHMVRVGQVAIGVLLLGSAAMAHSLIFLDVPSGAPFNNFFESHATGLNNRGHIVGHYGRAQGGNQGFLYERGMFTPIEVRNSFFTTPYKINDRGVIVGVFQDERGSHGFRFDGLYATIDVPFVPVGNTRAFGINNRGQIVGSYKDGTMDHGFLYDKGRFTSFDFPDSTSTIPYAINNKGQIVGSFNDGVQDRSFLYDDGVFTPLNVPFAQNFGDAARGINDRGDIVGSYQAPEPLVSGGRVLAHGYIAIQGVFSKFDVPQAVPFSGRVDTRVWDINERGNYVGSFFTLGNSANSGFLATNRPGAQ